MTDWYYHDPAQGGRVGPLSAGQLRERYVDRRIQADTLAWHAGVQEWQPLERFAEELALHAVRPDASRPPPLPPPPPPGSAAAASYGRPPRAGVRGAAPPPRRGLSGCAIVAIVAAVAAVPVLAILAAIAIPAYNDYTIRANSTAGILGAASAMQRAVEEFSQAHGRCPGNEDFAPLLRHFQAQGKGTTVRFGALAGGNCAFEFTLHGNSTIEGRTLVYEAVRDGDLVDWDCSGGDLPDRYRPMPCRGD